MSTVKEKTRGFKSKLDLRWDGIVDHHCLNLLFVIHNIYDIFQALATVKEKSRELEHRETLVRTLYRDREQALTTLKKHGIAVNKNINVSVLTEENVKKTRKEYCNSSLFWRV